MRCFALCVLAVAGGCGTKWEPDAGKERASAATRSRAGAVKVTAIQLFEDYGKNPLAGDTKYKGRAVEVSGRGAVKASAAGGYELGFQVPAFPAMSNAQLAQLSPRERQWFRDGGYPPNVIAHLSKSAEAEAAKVGRGATVRVIGFVTGTRKADVWHDYVVDLEDCELHIDPPATPKKK